MKKKIEEIYVRALNEDMPPNVFADEVLHLFKISGSFTRIDLEKAFLAGNAHSNFEDWFKENYQ